MSVAWLVRTGFTKITLQHGVIVVGWDLDLTHSRSEQDVLALYRATWPRAAGQKMHSKVRQMWAFTGEMSVGDIVLMPLPRDKPGRAGAWSVEQVRHAMERTCARSGMLVSWTGFNKDGIAEAFREPRISLRTVEDIVDAFLQYYGELSQTTRDKVPLRHMWVPDCPDLTRG